MLKEFSFNQLREAALFRLSLCAGVVKIYIYIYILIWLYVFVISLSESGGSQLASQ